jgi:Tol biopolymer transport system component
VTAELERIISKALEKDPDLRYQHASDIRTDLKRLKRDTDSDRSPLGAGLVSVPEGHTQGVPLRQHREEDGARGASLQRRLWLAAFGGAALIVAAVLAFLFRSPLPPPRVTGSTQVTKDGRDKELMVTDGSRVFFSSISGFNYALYEASTAGGDTVPFQTSIPNPVVDDISPDRSELLVGRCTGFTEDDCPLWVLPVLGRSPHRLGTLRASFTAGAATWSPDGKQIVYAQGNSLYRAETDGTEFRKIASVPSGGYALWPRWSPDGSRLRFSVTPELLPSTNTQNNRTSLWEVSADGKNLHPLLSGWNNPSAECCGSWTPDGKYFLFQSQRGGTSNIWAIREERNFFRKVNHEPVQLTTGPTSTYAPLSSTDGKKVFVVSAQVRGELVRYDSASHRRGRSSLPWLKSPRWSPDGRHILSLCSKSRHRSGGS